MRPSAGKSFDRPVWLLFHIDFISISAGYHVSNVEAGQPRKRRSRVAWVRLILLMAVLGTLTGIYLHEKFYVYPKWKSTWDQLLELEIAESNQLGGKLTQSDLHELTGFAGVTQEYPHHVLTERFEWTCLNPRSSDTYFICVAYTKSAHTGEYELARNFLNVMPSPRLMSFITVYNDKMYQAHDAVVEARNNASIIDVPVNLSTETIEPSELQKKK